MSALHGGETAVRANGVMRIYPGAAGNVAALRGLDLEVAPGQVVAVVGASGSGKSTLMRILAGLDRPSAGSVEALTVPLERARERELVRYRDEVGVIDQQYWRFFLPSPPPRHPGAALRRGTAARGLRRGTCASTDAPAGRRTDRRAR
jgi:ABC-type oligopeptide transport system ATPase subunit